MNIVRNKALDDERAARWYELFSRHAADLYPHRDYSQDGCRILAEMGGEVLARAREKRSLLLAHNYVYPELQEIALEAGGFVGDSLGLSLKARDVAADRIDFVGVYFMGETAKTIDAGKRVFVQDTPVNIGCSLVFGTDYEELVRWKNENPAGILITYVNSSARVKAISDYVVTSRNAAKVIVHAAREYPAARILLLPDKYLGYIMKARATKQGVDPDRIDIYTKQVGNNHASCYVHDAMGDDRLIETALLQYPLAELLIHPECGCVAQCLHKLEAGIIPREKAEFYSTEQMVERALASGSQEFIVVTEAGMTYVLRKKVPHKTFHSLNNASMCKYMKGNTMEKLLMSLREDRYEIVMCDDCCNPAWPYRDDHVIHLPQSVARGSRMGIERMLAIA